ncbi:iron-sulfur cluster assembly protein [Nocardioides halotolerans]|uniref:metal-sulfur cluster assembly factor n=1 Tax=Nocardioides halotolerans TaxID=433660 RepID=UPI0009FE6EC0
MTSRTTQAQQDELGSVREAVWTSLGRLVDPCSEGLGQPIDVVSLGLIESVDVDADTGVVQVSFCPTGASCFFQMPLLEEIERRVTEVTGWRCETEIHDQPWTPDRMNPPHAIRRPHLGS